MKIIGVDNLNRDEIADLLVCENINEFYGKLIIDFLNQEEGYYFYRLVEDDHRLSRGMEDLV